MIIAKKIKMVVDLDVDGVTVILDLCSPTIEEAVIVLEHLLDDEQPECEDNNV